MSWWTYRVECNSRYRPCQLFGEMQSARTYEPQFLPALRARFQTSINHSPSWMISFSFMSSVLVESVARSIGSSSNMI